MNRESSIVNPESAIVSKSARFIYDLALLREGAADGNRHLAVEELVEVEIIKPSSTIF